jgi:hypothetical protein
VRPHGRWLVARSGAPRRTPSRRSAGQGQRRPHSATPLKISSSGAPRGKCGRQRAPGRPSAPPWGPQQPVCTSCLAPKGGAEGNGRGSGCPRRSSPDWPESWSQRSAAPLDSNPNLVYRSQLDQCGAVARPTRHVLRSSEHRFLVAVFALLIVGTLSLVALGGPPAAFALPQILAGAAWLIRVTRSREP